MYQKPTDLFFFKSRYGRMPPNRMLLPGSPDPVRRTRFILSVIRRFSDKLDRQPGDSAPWVRGPGSGCPGMGTIFGLAAMGKARRQTRRRDLR